MQETVEKKQRKRRSPHSLLLHTRGRYHNLKYDDKQKEVYLGANPPIADQVKEPQSTQVIFWAGVKVSQL